MASSFTEMVKTVMTTPSYTEKGCCSESLRNFYLDRNTINDNFNDLEQAIKNNFRQIGACNKCGLSPKLTRKFEQQVFIEV